MEERTTTVRVKDSGEFGRIGLKLYVEGYNTVEEGATGPNNRICPWMYVGGDLVYKVGGVDEVLSVAEEFEAAARWIRYTYKEARAEVMEGIGL